jgi:segregation and condensation protein B
MLRVEAAIFASAKPVPREALVRVVGQDCRFDDLIGDLIHELRGRPYDLTLVAGGYALRTKTRFAPAIRAAHPGRAGGCGWGAHQDRDLRPHRDCLFAAGDAGGDFQAGGPGDQPRRDRLPQAPWPDRRRDQPGAPFAYVTTRKFLEAFGFASLRDLPDLERLKAEGLLEQGQGAVELDKALGMMSEEEGIFANSSSE